MRHLKTLLKEPLLHFLLIGLALFLVFQAKDPGSAIGKQRIVVAGERVTYLASAYEKAWGRAPTDADLQGLVDDWVREEIAVREATAAGLDRDDPVIRRRLRQKFEVMAEEKGGRAGPTDAELETYLQANAERFARPATVTFDQIVLTSQAIGDVERLEADTKKALARGAQPAELGQRSMLPSRVQSSGLDLVARDFGADFAARIEKLAVGAWSGPIRSPFGVHMVRVMQVVPGGTPPLAEVRSVVEREWETARRLEARATSYRKLLEGYDLVIEMRRPGPLAGR